MNRKADYVRVLDDKSSGRSFSLDVKVPARGKARFSYVVQQRVRAGAELANAAGSARFVNNVETAGVLVGIPAQIGSFLASVAILALRTHAINPAELHG